MVGGAGCPDQGGFREPPDPGGEGYVGRVESRTGVRPTGTPRGTVNQVIGAPVPNQMAGAATPPYGTDRAPITVRIGSYRLEAATGFGPRLTSLRRDDGSELFAQLSRDVAIDFPPSGTFRFHGGHRLWAAPEIPSITYAPDDHQCDVSAGDDELTITAPADASGFVKQLSVGLDGNGLAVDHRLTNAAPESASVAAWAITQFRLGGVALLPIAPSVAGDEFQADRSLVLWSYTVLTDRGCPGNRAAVVAATAGPRFNVR